MVEVYALNVNSPDFYEHISLFSSYVTPEKQERLKRYRSVEDVKRSLYGDILIRWITTIQFSITNDDVVFEFSEFDKPMLRDYANFHFNISHAGDWVVCATSNKEVGIDIELIKPVDFQMVKRICTREEQSLFNKLSDNEKGDFFYSIWTQKESYLKCLGQGLNFPLAWINSVSHDEEAIIQFEDEKDLKFHQYAIDQGYKLTACSVESLFDEEIQYINIQSIKLS